MTLELDLADLENELLDAQEKLDDQIKKIKDYNDQKMEAISLLGDIYKDNGKGGAPATMDAIMQVIYILEGKKPKFNYNEYRQGYYDRMYASSLASPKPTFKLGSMV